MLSNIVSPWFLCIYNVQFHGCLRRCSMESSVLSRLPVFPRIETQPNWFRARSVGLRRTNSIRRCVGRASQDCRSFGSIRGGYRGGLGGFSRVWGHSCDSAFLGRGKDEVVGYWMRRGWHVESGPGGCVEKSVHFVGIGGSGLSALALFALQQVIAVAITLWIYLH